MPGMIDAAPGGTTGAAAAARRPGAAPAGTAPTSTSATASATTAASRAAPRAVPTTLCAHSVIGMLRPPPVEAPPTGCPIVPRRRGNEIREPGARRS